MGSTHIRVRGARVHNLQSVDVDLPRDQLVVLTGLSGSGKSSLAFDTIYAEGQRRYVESLSSYARQFLQMQDKPDVDKIEGLSPAISIEQKTISRNPRSTVATITEIADYLRLLYARAGQPFCYGCGKCIDGKTSSQIVDDILVSGCKGQQATVLAPMIRQRKGAHVAVLQQLRKEGFVRVRIDGETRLLEEDIDLSPRQKHTIEVVVDRLVLGTQERSRVAEAVEMALRKAGGLVLVILHGAKDKGSAQDDERLFSEHFNCPDCGISYPELEPRMFSFNAPQGACRTCKGLGSSRAFSEHLVVPNPKLSLAKGAIAPFRNQARFTAQISRVAKKVGFSMNTAWGDLSVSHQEVVLRGLPPEVLFSVHSDSGNESFPFYESYEGVMPLLQEQYRYTTSENKRSELQRYMVKTPCDECGGSRLRKEACHVRVGDKSIHEVMAFSVEQAREFFSRQIFSGNQQVIAAPIVKEIHSRLSFLACVGLPYLTLERSAGTLSGGEAQRIRLASQVGSALAGVLYVLDEPSIGLHQRDNEKLLKTLYDLRDLGNTVLVVEHDEETIRAADYVVDMGPGAGRLGGKVVAQGSPQQIEQHLDSITGQYLRRSRCVPVPSKRRKGNGHLLRLTGACGNNLKNVQLEIPLGAFVCVTGVSGSGKSSLVMDTLYKAVAQQLFFTSRDQPLSFQTLEGVEFLRSVIDIDQSPIGRTPRSNPATYVGAFEGIRNVFSSLPEARTRGYKPGRFSFNVKGGRCEACLGAGILKIEMNFLADVYVVCETCKGKRFNDQTLNITYRGKSISDVLEMTVEEAATLFSPYPDIARKLQALQEVGLGYIHLGQQATTLSGGEAQRVKLSKELSRRQMGCTLYILDEPTTGLHFEDVRQLLESLQRLVDQGNTVIVIEHNLDVIKAADHVIDIGPEGGNAGGYVVATGTPEQVAQHPHSHTACFLSTTLKR
ncbi:MAG: excinuclease ABC subunit UvrA [Myxococcota bacterium]